MQSILIQMELSFVALLGPLDSSGRGLILTGRIAALLRATLKGHMFLNETYCVMDRNGYENEWLYQLFN